MRVSRVALSLGALAVCAALAAAPAAASPGESERRRCSMAVGPGWTEPRGDIVVRHGDPLQIDCAVYRDPDAPPSALPPDSSRLRFYRGHRPVEPEFLTIVNETTLRLRIERPPVSDSTYYCKLEFGPGNATGVCLNNVVVATPPADVDDFACVAEDWENLTCSWTSPRNPLATTYELTYRFPGRPGGVALYRCPQVEVAGDRRSCFWNYRTQPHYRKSYPHYQFYLEARNALGVNRQNITFDNYARVRPSPPVKFRLLGKTAHSASLAWDAPEPMRGFPPGLRHRLSYTSELRQGVWRTVDLPAFERNETAHFRYDLLGLETANDWYDVRVQIRSASARPEELWSNFSSITFRTAAELPARPPEVAPGGFESTAGLAHRSLYLYWQSLHPDEENGNSFAYRVEVDGEPPVRTTKTYAFFERFPLGETSLSVFSENEIGRSARSSRITVPAQDALLPEPKSFTKIAFPNRTYELSWGYDDGPVDGFTIFWCDNARDRPYQCEGRLKWTSVPAKPRIRNVSVDDDKIYQFAISADGGNRSSGMVWASCTVIPNRIVGKMRNVWIDAVGDTFIEVVWKLECSDRIGVVRGYRISYCPIASPYNKTCSGEERNVTVDGDASDVRSNLTGLLPYTTYAITVAIVTSYGDGTPSDRLCNTTSEGAPTPPRDVSVSEIGNSGMLVSWTPPESMNGVLKEYVVRYESAHRRSELKVSRAEAEGGGRVERRLSDLAGFADYAVSVVACTTACSPPSERVVARTTVGPPGPVRALASNSTAAGTALSWRPPAIPGGSVDKYQVRVTKKMRDRRNHTEDYETASLLFNLPFPICREKDVHSYSYAVRAINLDSDAVYKGPWEVRDNDVCRDDRGVDVSLVVVLVVSTVALALFVAYAARCGYAHYKTMKDIKVCLPPGLESLPDHRDSKPTSKWGAPAGPPPDAEFQLLMNESPNCDLKRAADNCDNSNCSVNTDSTALSLTSSGGAPSDDAGKPDAPADADADAARMAPYSAVSAWPPADGPRKRDAPAAPEGAPPRGYVSIGSVPDGPFGSARAAPAEPPSRLAGVPRVPTAAPDDLRPAPRVSGYVGLGDLALAPPRLVLGPGAFGDPDDDDEFEPLPEPEPKRPAASGYVAAPPPKVGLASEPAPRGPAALSPEAYCKFGPNADVPPFDFGRLPEPARSDPAQSSYVPHFPRANIL